jgi:hypothetical protein
MLFLKRIYKDNKAYLHIFNITIGLFVEKRKIMLLL